MRFQGSEPQPEPIELEVVDLDDLDDLPPPPPRPPLRTRLRRRWREVAAAVAVVGLLLGAYVGVATIGVRRLEAYWVAAEELGEELDDYLAAQRRAQRIGELRVTSSTSTAPPSEEATRAYYRRLDRLRRQAAQMIAVDPGVRRLRRRVVSGLGLLQTPAANRAAVDEVLAGQRARWRLHPGDPPAPRPLALRNDRDPFVPTPSRDRLVVELEEDLVELDLDRGTGRVIEGNEVGGSVKVGRHVVYVHGDDAKAVEVGTEARPRALGPADQVLASHDGRTVWLVTGQVADLQGSGAEPQRTLTRVDVTTGERGTSLTVAGEVAAASGGHVAVMRYARRTSTIELWDAEQRSVVRRVPGRILDLRGDLLVRRTADEVRVASLSGGPERTIPPHGTTGFAASATVAPDGSAIAVLWAGQESASRPSGALSIVATSDLREIAAVELPGNEYPAVGVWSPDGRRLYLVADPIGREGLPGIKVFRVAERVVDTLPLEGPIYDIAAF